MRVRMSGKMKRTDAYFTVEAALVLPFVIGVVLLTIYLLFFQYNRCLMEQAALVLSMRGCTLQIVDREELVLRLSEQFHSDDKPYLAWSMEDAKISLKGNCIKVECLGNIKFPFPGLAFWHADNMWESGIVCESQRIRPANLIRNYKKIMGGK